MKLKCSVCGKRFMPNKESVYLASECPSVIDVFTKAQREYEAVDCPRCGCQKLLKIRVPKIEEGGLKDEAESET